MIGNALKYSSRTGQPRVDVTGKVVDGTLALQVLDNGIGLGDTDGERAFNLFERLPVARAFPGSGVGLAGAREVAAEALARLGYLGALKAARNLLAPNPSPPLALRPRTVAVTQVDRLAADPYAFYASRILKLQKLEMVDADPGPAWRGTLVHCALELWFREDKCAPDRLETRTVELVRGIGSHPILRALWLPRMLEAVRWVSGEVEIGRASCRERVSSPV